MRRSLLWILLLTFLLVVSGCSLDRRGAGSSAEGDTSGTLTPRSPVPAPTRIVPAIPRNDTPSPESSGITLPEVKLPDVGEAADALATAQAALQQAGDAAGTAVQQAGTVAHQAGDAAGTAAAVATEQGGAALATVQAINTPDLSRLTELTDRLAAARPDEDGFLTVTLNESELNQLLQLRYLVMSSEPELRDATVRFESGVMVLSGNVPLLLPVGVTLSLRPVVADGRFELEILDAALGRLQAPDLVLAFASNLVSSGLSDVIRRLPEGFQLQSIAVDEGLLTIRGRVNN